jgi:hypothetical protein
LLESDPGAQTPDENIVFAKTEQVLDRLAIQQGAFGQAPTARL